VLVVFDYEPSTVGEMDNGRFPDHMISAAPQACRGLDFTGPPLRRECWMEAERPRVCMDRRTNPDIYLWPTGVQAFAQDPVATMPWGGSRVGGNRLLAGAGELGEFGHPGDYRQPRYGRTWIEQTANSRAVLDTGCESPGYLLLPFRFRPVAGLVADSHGAAGAIANNGCRGWFASTGTLTRRTR
jgi:hypothetical protein